MSLNLSASFDSPVKTWDFLKSESVDLVFSDIAMPDVTGISFLKSLKVPPCFIFITANPGYAAESYELDVVDYIVKPYDYGRFMKVVNKVEAVLSKKTIGHKDKDYLIIKDGYKNVVKRFDDIFFIDPYTANRKDTPVRVWLNISTAPK